MISKIRIIQDIYRILGFRGVWVSICAKITNRPSIFSIQRSDCIHPIHIRIPSSDSATYKQIFIDNEYDFASNTDQKVIIDAGANIGLAAVYFANRYPDAQIIAIEPELSNFEILKSNIKMYPNITPINGALWNKNEEINLIDPGLGEWGFMTEMKGSEKTVKINNCHVVEAFTLDKIISNYKLEKINILKIDIEGAEREVFSDTSLWIDKVDSIIIELHERFKTGCNRSFYLGSSGFDKEWLQGENIYLSKNNSISKRK